MSTGGGAAIVLIHGAYQGGWIWREVAAHLRAAGHRVLCPTLDGCAERAGQLRPGITTESHGAEIAGLLFHEDVEQAVLVGTSTGGMVMAAAAERARERVGRLVFADALALRDGERLGDIVTRRNTTDTALATGPSREDAAARLFAGLAPPVKAWALERYSLHPVAVMREPVALPRFWSQRWRASVIWCAQSVNPPRAHQRRTAEALDAGWHELDTGHYPMLSEPARLAELIAEG